MTLKQAVAWVKEQGVVLESARGPIANLADQIAGEPVSGRWWGHPKGHQIFGLLRGVRSAPEVLVCRLVDGKVTFVHRRLWPALVRLAPLIGTDRLSKIEERHTKKGRHEVRETAFPSWVPADILAMAEKLSEGRARGQLPGNLRVIENGAS